MQSGRLRYLHERKNRDAIKEKVAYPSKTLHLLISGLNRYLADGKHDNNFNVLEKAD